MDSEDNLLHPQQQPSPLHNPHQTSFGEIKSKKEEDYSTPN